VCIISYLFHPIIEDWCIRVCLGVVFAIRPYFITQLYGQTVRFWACLIFSLNLRMLLLYDMTTGFVYIETIYKIWC